jgi:hypothetical protein
MRAVMRHEFRGRMLSFAKNASVGKCLVNRGEGWSWICGIGGLPKLGLGKARVSSGGGVIH